MANGQQDDTLKWVSTQASVESSYQSLFACELSMDSCSQPLLSGQVGKWKDCC